jgi:hypothetical protein
MKMARSLRRWFKAENRRVSPRLALDPLEDRTLFAVSVLHPVAIGLPVAHTQAPTTGVVTPNTISITFTESQAPAAAIPSLRTAAPETPEVSSVRITFDFNDTAVQITFVLSEESAASSTASSPVAAASASPLAPSTAGTGAATGTRGTPTQPGTGTTGNGLTQGETVVLETLTVLNAFNRVVLAAYLPTQAPPPPATIPGRELLPSATANPNSSLILRSAAANQSSGDNSAIPLDLDTDVLVQDPVPARPAPLVLKAETVPPPKQAEQAPKQTTDSDLEVALPAPLLRRVVDAYFSTEPDQEDAQPQEPLAVAADTEAPVTDWSYGRVSMAVLLAGYAGLCLRDAEDRTRRTSI